MSTLTIPAKTLTLNYWLCKADDATWFAEFQKSHPQGSDSPEFQAWFLKELKLTVGRSRREDHKALGIINNTTGKYIVFHCEKAHKEPRWFPMISQIDETQFENITNLETWIPATTITSKSLTFNPNLINEVFQTEVKISKKA